MLALIAADKIKVLYGECCKRKTEGLEPAFRGSGRYSTIHTYAQIAQLVEQRTENPRVAGSIPALGIFLICGCSSMVEHQPSKLDTWVRFPSPACHRESDKARIP